MSANIKNVTLEAITSCLGEYGLVCRGAFHPREEDLVPDIAEGQPVATLILAGNAGPSMWQAFSRSAWASEHALDNWSSQVLGEVATRAGGIALLPFGGPPWLPFQRWAQRSDTVWPSPLGILVHADYGLWHAYRGAIGVGERLELPAKAERNNPCDACADRPCLTTCPVSAFDGAGYDVPVCVAFVEGADGGDCAESGCAARRSCPIGRNFVYDPAQAAFHMRAFVRNHTRLH